MVDTRPLGPAVEALRTSRMVVEAIRQRRFPYASPGTVGRAQDRRVMAAVAYARSHVPYYRETMRRMLLGPEDLRSASDLAKLPLLEREQLQRDPEYFLSEQWPAEQCIALHSGGTTGAPVPIFRDPPALFAQAAHYERFRSVIRRLAGVSLHYREAAIVPADSSTTTGVSAFRQRARLPARLRVQLRSYSMLRSPVDTIRDLNAWQPQVITSYGSYLEALFSYVREHEPEFHPPKVAVYGADPLSPAVRDWAKEALRTEVLGIYGAIEAPHIGFECEHHLGYHLNVDLYPVRLVDDDGRKVQPDARGEVVISNLIGRGTVLLNYRLGDVVALRSGGCPCGRSLPLCTYLERRGTRWLTLGRGYKIHSQALQLVLRAEPDIWRYQLVQESRDHIVLRLIVSPACARDQTATRILERMQRQLPAEVSVRVEFVSDLPRAPSGKVQAVIALNPA